MSMIEIRDATADDAPAIADAHTTAWRVAYRGEIPDSVLDDPAMGQSRIDGWTRRLTDGPPQQSIDPDNRIFVPVLGGRVVGFGHAGLEAPRDDHQHRGEIYGFYLHPDAWGSGAGGALMDVCLDELRSRFDSAVLWVLKQNPRARRFYEKTGWSCTDRELLWDGPQTSGTPMLPEPVVEIEYHIEF